MGIFMILLFLCIGYIFVIIVIFFFIFFIIICLFGSILELGFVWINCVCIGSEKEVIKFCSLYIELKLLLVRFFIGLNIFVMISGIIILWVLELKYWRYFNFWFFWECLDGLMIFLKKFLMFDLFFFWFMYIIFVVRICFGDIFSGI